MIIDFSRQLHYVWALLPEIILCISGMAILVVGVTGKYREAHLAVADELEPERSGDLGWLALLSLSLAAVANAWLYGVTEVGVNSMIAVDQFRLFSNWIFLLAAVLGILISFAYVYRQRLQAGEFYALILFATSGMMFMAGARDLIVVFLGLEVMSIAVYALTAFNRRDRKSAEAGLKYFLLGAFSTGFLLYGIALVYGATGSTNVAVIGEIISSGEGSQNLLSAAIALLTIGFAFKVSAIPFHMWTPDVYEGAPAPVTAWMSAAVKAAGFVAFLRVLMVGFDSMYPLWYPILWWLAAITMVGANLIALVQTNIKRMLAYSSIAHAGYLLVAIAAANETASAGMLFYLLVYTLMNMGAFAIVMSVSHHSEKRLYIDNYVGFGWAQPLLGIFLTIFLLSLAGFPGTGGFMGKIYLLLGAAESDLWALSVILVLTTVLSYWYYLRVAWVMWMKNPEVEGQHDRITVPLPMRFALLVSVGLILYVGILPSGTLEFARASIEGLGTFGGGLLGQGP